MNAVQRVSLPEPLVLAHRAVVFAVGRAILYPQGVSTRMETRCGSRFVREHGCGPGGGQANKLIRTATRVAHSQYYVGFWDNNTVVRAGTMAFHRDFSGTTRI